MACCERNTGIMLILVLCLALWNLSNCAVIGTVHLSKGSYDKAWQKDFTLPILPTFDRRRFTSKPEDRDNKPTPAPFDFNRFTLKPEGRDDKPTPGPFDFNRFTIDWNIFTIDWGRLSINPFDPDTFTRKPFEWNRPTSKPYEWDRITNRDDYRYNNKDSNNTALKLIIILPVLGLVIIVWMLRYGVCNDQSDSAASTPIEHPPPERVIPPTTNVHFSSENDLWTSQNARQELSFTVPIVVPNENFRVTSSHNRSNATDKPPAYTDVVLSDMCGQQNAFPEVNPTNSEPPPPQYDDKKMRY